jgi:hypothetical protein
LINAAGQREHCHEMEELIDQFSSEAEKTLQERPADRDLKQEFGSRLLASLPLRSLWRQCLPQVWPVPDRTGAGAGASGGSRLVSLRST